MRLVYCLWLIRRSNIVLRSRATRGGSSGSSLGRSCGIGSSHLRGESRLLLRFRCHLVETCNLLLVLKSCCLCPLLCILVRSCLGCCRLGHRGHLFLSPRCLFGCTLRRVFGSFLELPGCSKVCLCNGRCCRASCWWHHDNARRIIGRCGLVIVRRFRALVIVRRLR